MAAALWRAGLPSRYFTTVHPIQFWRALPSSSSSCRCQPTFARSSSSAQMYHHLDVSSTPHVPFAPPVPRHSLESNAHVPIVPHVTSAVVDGGKAGAKKRKRKQKYLDSLMEKAGELSLKCSILDAEGNWTAEEGKYKKSELCRDHDLSPRDLRKLDSLTPNLVPIILTRRTCILISMLHLRVLIKPDRVIVFETAGSMESDVQRRFKWHLEKNVRSGVRMMEDSDSEDDLGALSYEHRALESVLVATANALEEEMGYARTLVQDLLVDLEDNIDRDNLKRLLHYSRRIMEFQSRARYVKRAVDEVLESDEDLSAMYLTSKALGRPRALHDHEQLELLLESFAKQVEEIVSEVDTTVANMQSTQEIAELMLDSGRNALLALEVKISIGTLGVGTGALVAGMFGMNLTTHLEDNPYAFWIVSSGLTAITFVIFAIGVKIMRRIRRVALSGRDATPLRRTITPEAWDAMMASLARGPHTRHVMPVPSRSPFGNLRMLLRWRPWPRRAYAKLDEPVRVEEHAEMARFREPWVSQSLNTGRASESRSLDEAWKETVGQEAGWAHKRGKSGEHRSGWARM